jgi:tRNA(Arg) A34 adenosine deaminase TadA
MNNAVLILALTLLFLPMSTSVQADDETSACIERKSEAIGKALRCHLSQDPEASHAEYHSADSECSAKLERRLEKAEIRYGPACPTQGDAERIPEWTKSLSQRVFDAIDGKNPTLDYAIYMVSRGPTDPDPIIHMRALVEHTKENRAAALAYCASQEPPVSAADCAGAVPFCAFVVDRRSDSIVAKACNHGGANPMLHGEVAAINAVSNVFQARGIAFREVAHNYDLYTTGESCAMCSGAIMWAGFKSVFFGSTVGYMSNFFSQIQISNRELAGLWTDCTNETTVRTVVVGPILEEENNALFDEFGPRFCPDTATQQGSRVH